MSCVPFFLSLVGHVGIWCLIFNRTHATAWPRTWRKMIERCIVMTVLIPLLGLPWLAYYYQDFSIWSMIHNSPIAGVYSLISLVAFAFFFVTWIIRISTYRHPREIELVERRYVDCERQLGRRLTHGPLASALRLIPGNQAAHLSFETRVWRHAKVTAKNPIRICHLSDFHLTGQIDQEFFRFAIQEVNAWEPDLIFLTGDLVDELHCLDWIEPVFGKLRSRFGSYYLLGNHDRRIPSEHNLRDRLERVGLVRAGGRWIDLDVNGQALSIAGNELPWYPGAESLSPRANHDALQILLTHSPDQIDWARPFGFDLIFAGHTHGGQIRLPVVGPIISPSKYGVRFAGGSFTVDRSVMHVSRGICGDEPIRILCPPEIGFFLLQSPESPTTQSSAVSSR